MTISFPPAQFHLNLVQLGENGTSWGYGGTAKKSHDNKYLNYGDKFGAGDSIMCYIDLESNVSLVVSSSSTLLHRIVYYLCSRAS